MSSKLVVIQGSVSGKQSLKNACISHLASYLSIGISAWLLNNQVRRNDITFPKHFSLNNSSEAFFSETEFVLCFNAICVKTNSTIKGQIETCR